MMFEEKKTQNLKKIFIIVLMGLLAVLPVAGAAQDRDEICKTLSNERVEQRSALPYNTRDYRLYNVYVFYSEKLDTCIHVGEKLIGADVWVEDLTQSVIKIGLMSPAKYPPALLHCDEYGVDEANIDVVRRNKGSVWEIPYKEWLTDGQGGLPRALKTPDQPFDRVACENALKRWLVLWGP